MQQYYGQRAAGTPLEPYLSQYDPRSANYRHPNYWPNTANNSSAGTPACQSAIAADATYIYQPPEQREAQLTTTVDQAGQVWRWNPYWNQWIPYFEEPVVQRTATQGQGSWYNSAAYANKGTYWDGEKWSYTGELSLLLDCI
jgi:hypothetical protein